jgi:hypothetical protein
MATAEAKLAPARNRMDLFIEKSVAGE